MSTDAQPVLVFGRWKSWPVAVALFLGVFFLNAFGTGSVPLLYINEAKFSEASREMRERNDWVVPHYNGEFRLDKPPLIYWCQAAAMTLLGENEFAARLPSVLSGAILAVVIFWFGARLRDGEAGFWAAVVFSTSLRVVFQAKWASADMLLTLFVTLAFWAGWELTREQAKADGRTVSAPAWRTGWWWLFYASLALSFLTKGPAGWMPLYALPFYRWWAKPAGLNRRFRFELGLPLMAGLIALWAAPAYLRTHGEFLRVGVGTHIVTRMTQGYDGHGAANIWIYLVQTPFYFVAVFFSMIGWSTWFPWCYKRLRAENYGGDTGRYLLAGILVTFCIFTAGWSRRQHYTMPVFPLIALLLAMLWWRAGRSERVLAWVGGALVAVAVAVVAIRIPIDIRTNPCRELARRCAPFLSADSAFGTVEMDQAGVVWYFRQHVHGFRQLLKADEAAAFMAQSGPRFCVMQSEVAEAKFHELPTGWRRIDAPGEGYYTEGRKQKLMVTVLIKP